MPEKQEKHNEKETIRKTIVPVSNCLKDSGCNIRLCIFIFLQRDKIKNSFVLV